MKGIVILVFSPCSSPGMAICCFTAHSWQAGKTQLTFILLKTCTFAERAKQKTYPPALNFIDFIRALCQEADFTVSIMAQASWVLSKCSFPLAGSATSSLGYGKSALLVMKEVMKNSLVTFCAESMR